MALGLHRVGLPRQDGAPCLLPRPSPIDRPILTDHPIFLESLRLIGAELAARGIAPPADPLERDLLERCIHSCGDLTIAADLHCSTGACAAGAAALAAGAPILTDTAMAAAAVAPMAGRTFNNPVQDVLAWAPATAPAGSTRTAVGMERALQELGAGLVVLVGSAPTALERLLALVAVGAVPAPALVIGMPVGFVGVEPSKRHLAASGLAQVRLDGSRGGAGLVAAACNALLRAAWLQAAR
jgi:precorrin-8X/cobalt-precorrin-8 methylmutase